jgi:RIO kinase 1
MASPDRLLPLIDLGAIDEVLRPLMSGKEADVFLVIARGRQAVAKVYKEASQRSFKHRADYTEGRKTRNTRTQRAIEKKSKFGREQLEAAWRNTEVDVIYRLRAAGVTVPEPYEFVDGVLVMELVADSDGRPAPRLIDTPLDEALARKLFKRLSREIIRMLLAGVVHGDLSDFNILLGHDGPVIIDFPQAVDPAFNQSAKRLFVRDVDNLTRFLARGAPELRDTHYGAEIWHLYESGTLTEDSPLTGKAPKSKGKASPDALLREFAALEAESRARREQAGVPRKTKFERPTITADDLAALRARAEAAPAKTGRRKKRGSGRAATDGPPEGRQPTDPTPEARPPKHAARPGKPRRGERGAPDNGRPDHVPADKPTRQGRPDHGPGDGRRSPQDARHAEDPRSAADGQDPAARKRRRRRRPRKPRPEGPPQP